MKMSRFYAFCFVAVFSVVLISGAALAEDYKIAVVQKESMDAQSFAALVDHLAKRGVAVTLVDAPTYREVPGMLSAGKIDAMFSGTGIAGSMITIHRLKVKQMFAGYRPANEKIQQAMLAIDRR